MKDIVAADVYKKDGELVTTSLAVAERFSKKHQHVLEKIKNIECSQEFMLSNFRQHNYVDHRGNEQPMYEMTDKGFMLLTMGFTGKKAMMAKEWFIAVFDKMRKTLETHHENSISFRDELAEILKNYSSQLVRNDAEIAEVKTDIVTLKSDVQDNSVKIQRIEESRRKNFTNRSRAIYNTVVSLYYDSNCPCCQSRMLPPIEYDHWYNKPSKNKLNEGWAICPDCHAKFSEGKWSRTEREVYFKSFQMRVAEYKNRQGYMFGGQKK